MSCHASYRTNLLTQRATRGQPLRIQSGGVGVPTAAGSLSTPVSLRGSLRADPDPVQCETESGWKPSRTLQPCSCGATCTELTRSAVQVISVVARPAV